ncbi:MAG: preprotein translocase subunit SecY, partial [Clostridia bacterium]|nr:preprotein translocase subunit SecY [Clostridia bacterium]
RNVWRVPELRKKLLYTFFMLLIYRLVSVIPVPGLDPTNMVGATNDYQVLSLLSMMTGNAFSQLTIMAMGISPYINASIIMQLLTIAIPALERLQKDGGEEGKKKINRITRYVTVGLAALQAVGIIMALNNQYQVITSGYQNFWGYCYIGIVMAGGTALAMWIGERITKNGIGNGISLLIFAGIISNLFNGILGAVQRVFNGGGMAAVGQLATIVIATLVILVVVTYVDMAERRIPVQYAKRVVGRKMYGGQSSHIPLKLLAVGVLPLIFAYSFMAFPGTVLAIVARNSGVYQWWTDNMTQSSPLYMIICALLFIAFSFFYTSITFNPQDIAKNIQQQGGHIPGIRTGSKTVEYLSRTSNRLTLFAALFLAILSTIPSLLTVWQQVQIPFGASSILIAVSVAIETVRQVESQLVMRNYKGFLG